MTQTSLAQQAIKDSVVSALKTNPRFIVGFHNRNTLVNTEKVKLYGIMLGLDYNSKVKIFMGLYGFGGENRTSLINSSQFEEDTVVRLTSVSNLSIGAEYTFFQHKQWSFSWPVQVGFGAVYTDYHHKGRLIRRNDLGLIPIESGINVYYEIFNWLGIKGGAGYRLSLGKRSVRTMSAPYYNIGVSILVGNLYRDIRDFGKD